MSAGMPERGTLTAAPEIGSLWGGGGKTVRVLEVWDEDVKVLVLTGRGRVLKRPRATGLIPRKHFAPGAEMRPTVIPEALMPR